MGAVSPFGTRATLPDAATIERPLPLDALVAITHITRQNCRRYSPLRRLPDVSEGGDVAFASNCIPDAAAKAANERTGVLGVMFAT